MRQAGPGSNAIYILCLGLVLAIIVSLPLVHVPVSVTGKGIIKPEEERTEIVPSVSGVVREVLVKEGDNLKANAPLLKISFGEQLVSLEGDQYELGETVRNLKDLECLLDDPIRLPKNDRYIREYEAYTGRLDYLEIISKNAEKECSRHEGLYAQELVSQKEYEDLCFEKEKSLREIEGFRRDARSRWQADLNEFSRQKRVLENSIRQYRERIDLSTVYAPIGGNLVDLKGIYPGTAVSAGEVIGTISPDADLIGEFYLDPRNIALVHEGQPVRLNMHSFPSSQWGMPEGRIYNISDDFLMMDRQATYRVKCNLDRTSLSLKNGYTSHLKKGMTFQAHCIVVNRTLLQLLWDKTDRWLNPFTNATD